MHNLVTTVFKVLGITIIMLALVTAIGIVIDVFTVTNRVTSTAILMQNEMARHNGLPTEEISTSFATKLCDDVLGQSEFFTGVESNFGSSDTQNAVSSKGYGSSVSFGSVVGDGSNPVNEPIIPGVAYDYGDTINLVIRVNYNLVGVGGNGAFNTFFKGASSSDSHIDFKYSIPCLYFNK